MILSDLWIYIQNPEYNNNMYQYKISINDFVTQANNDTGHNHQARHLEDYSSLYGHRYEITYIFFHTICPKIAMFRINNFMFLSEDVDAAFS